MIPPLNEIQENLLRFRFMDNSLHFLAAVCEESTSSYNLTILLRYACLDLVNFLDQYNYFQPLLDEEEKKLVLAMKPFIEEIFKNEEELRNERNKWIAHVNRRYMPTEILTSTAQVSVQDMIIMINGIGLFVKGLEMIFPHQTDYLEKNVLKRIEDVMISSSINNETINDIINNKIRMVNTGFLSNNLTIQIDEEIYKIRSDNDKANS